MQTRRPNHHCSRLAYAIEDCQGRNDCVDQIDASKYAPLVTGIEKGHEGTTDDPKTALAPSYTQNIHVTHAGTMQASIQAHRWDCLRIP